MAYVIAEIGFNHEGDARVGAEMIRAAAEAGAQAVKFQSFRAGDIALPSSPHFDAIRSGELSREDHFTFASVARDCGVDFLSTPFGPWAVDVLEEIGVPAYKVASMDLANHHLLEIIARTGKPIHLSTGMASLEEVADTLRFLEEQKSGPVTLLHCLSLYPARAEDLNLAIIPFLKEVFQVPVGYSDHYPGVDACLAAALLGAEVIETHFTLDASKEGGDHGHSAEPAQLKTLVESISLYQTMAGNSKNIFHRPDVQFAKEFRRGVYAARDIGKGQVLELDDLQLCRPANALTPNDLGLILGKKTTQAVAAGESLHRGFLEWSSGE